MTRRRLGIAGIVLGLLLVAAATVGLVERGAAGDATGGGATTLPAAAGRLPVASAPAARLPEALPATLPAAPPAPGARLLLPRLRVAASIVRVGLGGAGGRVMQVPHDPRRVGWWTGGVAPGSAQGSAVIVGHVNYRGVAGALAALPRLQPGDRLELTRPALAFRVAAVRSYAKAGGLPDAIFARTGPAQLVLITCGGSFDAASGNYRDNVVVFAVPA